MGVEIQGGEVDIPAVELTWEPHGRLSNDHPVADYILYHSRHRVVVCVACGICIRPGRRQIDRHFKDNHQALPLKLRQEIQAHIYDLHLQPDPGRVTPPAPGEPPVPGLKSHDGHTCRQCVYYSPSERSIAEHARAKHDWKKEQGAQWTSATVQTFFGGNLRRYFEVSPSVKQERAPMGGLDGIIAGMLQEYTQAEQEETKTGVIAGVDDHLVTDSTPWLRRTRWLRKFAKRDLRQVQALSMKPAKDEPSLQRVWDSGRRLFERSRKSIARWHDDEDDGELVLRWLDSEQANQVKARPFSIYYLPETHARYTAVFLRCLCYLLRLVHSEDQHGHTFPASEETVALEIWSILELQDVEDAILDEAVARLSVGLWMHESRANSRSTLVHCCAVLGIRKNATFELPSNYGQSLAALLYCARLLLFEDTLPAATRHSIHDPCRTFVKVHHRWLVDGRPTPFNYITNLLAYAKGAGKDVGGKPRLQWTADRQTLIYQGQRLHMDQLRNFIQSLRQAAEEILYRDLLFLPEPSYIRSLDLRTVVDDLTDSNIGYSFISDPRNGLDRGLEKVLRRLSQDAQWTKLFEANSARRSNKRWEWYQRQEQAFKEILFTLSLVGKGSDGRGKEVLLVRSKNVAENMRSIFIFDGQIMIVSGYTKTLAVTGQEKVIPRFLPLAIAQLWVAYLETVPSLLELLDRDYLPQKHKSVFWADRKGLWDTNRATKALTEATSTRLGVRFTFQDFRHISKGIDREHIRVRKGVPWDDEEEEEEDDIFDLAHGHGTVTAFANYGIDASMLRSLSSQTISAFRGVADKWHSFLNLPSRQTPLPRGVRRRLTAVYDRPSGPLAKRPKLQEDKQPLQVALERLLGPGATFRSPEQRDALLEIERGTSPLVVVLPTGGGKSLCFQLPASMSGAGTVIVVVPFTALLRDIRGRCRGLGISCVQWTIESQQSASIVLVMAETATSDSFYTFASALQVSGSLRAIFLDECHVPITASAYRPKLADLDQLRKIPCQYVLRTGTLPPTLQSRLASALLLGTHDDGLRFVRALTDKPNIAYAVEVHSDRAIEERACQLMRDARENLAVGQKAILFCASVSICERIAQVLRCQPYHARWKEKQASMAAWVGGKEKLIIATSALGTGVDVAGVCVVLHLGRPYGLIDFVQGSGRGGRGGERVASTILLGRSEMQLLQTVTKGDADWEAMRQYLIASDCRRKQIGAFMDLCSRTCLEGKDEPCDLCRQPEKKVLPAAQGQKHDYRRGVELWQDRVRRRGLDRARIEHAVEVIGSSCAGCWVYGTAITEHRKQDCPRIADAVGGTYRTVRARIKYQGVATCWGCSQPGDWCSWYTSHRRCIAEDIIVPVVFAGRTHPNVCAILANEGVASVEDLTRWMGRPMQVGGSKGSKAAWLACRIIQSRVGDDLSS